MLPIKNFLSRMLANLVSFIMITSNVLVPTYSLPSLAAVSLMPNPALQPGCGINVALVLDASGSIDNTEQSQVRSAVNGFITALRGSGSKIAIVEFGTNADTPVPYTEDTTANAGVFSAYLATNNQPGPQYHDGRTGTATNWDAGMRQVNALSPAPDLVVVVTDGVPNAVGVPGTSNQSQQAAADAAALQANITKSSAGNQGAGSHILTIGVGINDANLPYMFQLTNGASAVQYDGSNFSTADYVNSSSFGNLLTDLTNISADLCSSSVTITKMVDETGAGTYAPAANWNFEASVTESAGTYTWVSPTQGGSGATQGATDADGKLFFQWDPSNINATSSIQIAETGAPGYEFVDVTCTLNGQPISVPQGEVFTISNIPLKGFANCIVRNKRSAGSITIVKSATPADSTPFAFTTSGSGVNDFSLVANASNSRTFSNLSNGTYTFTEANTSGWSLASLSCSGGSATTNVNSRTASVNLMAGENVICTFSNEKNGTIIVKKVTNPTGRPQSFAFTGDAAGSISDGQTIVVGNLRPGQYTSTEVAAANFNLSSITCDDGSSATPSSGNVGTRTATFNVDPGETVTCTFTNALVQQAASITGTIHNSAHSAITSGMPGLIAHDYAAVSGGDLGTPTGNVTISFYNNNTCSGAAAATSAPLTLNGSGNVDATSFAQGPLNAGNYSFQAHYNGDVNYLPATGACQPLTVNQNDVSLAAQLKHASDNSSVGAQISTGTTIYNSAILSGTTASAGGNVTYSTYLDSNCTVVDTSHPASSVSVSDAVVPNSSNATFNSAGMFYFQASYSGDINNKAATSACVSVEVVAPNLAITKVADAASVSPGTTIGYTITVTNNGQGTASNTSMTDVLPQVAGFNWTIDLANSDVGCVISLDTLTCNFGNLANGASKRVHVTTETTTAQAMCGTHNNSASTQASNNAQIAVGPVAISVNCMQGLSLTKSASPTSYNAVGQTITYSYTIRNTGNVNVGPSQFTVSDNKIDAGAPFNCGPAATTLAPNATVTCTHDYAITQADLDAGSVTNIATATAPGAPTTAPVQATVTANQSQALELAKSAQQSTFSAVGELITYVYEIRNTGNVTMGPAQFTVRDNKINGNAPFNCGSAISTLAPNASLTCTHDYAVTQEDLDAGFVTNIAFATLAGTNSAPAQLTILATQLPALSLEKSTSTASFQGVGDAISYSYLLTNTGNVTLAGPFHVGDDKTSVSCPSTTTLAPSQSIVCSSTYAATQGDLDAGSVTNVASGEGHFNLLPVVSNSDTVTVAAEQNRGLSIDKSASVSFYDRVGQEVVYTYVITNIGNVTLVSSQFTVSDDKIDNGAEFNCGPSTTTLAPNDTVTCTKTYLVTQHDLDAGSVTNRASASGAGVGPSQEDSVTITATARPMLEIAKSASQPTYSRLGEIIVYTYRVTNVGNVTQGPAQFTVRDNRINQGAPFACGPADQILAPSESVTCTHDYSITQGDLDAGFVTNTAVTEGGSASTSAPAVVTITAAQNPTLLLDKSTTDTSFASPNQVLSYSYVLTNTGNVTISGPFMIGDDKTAVTCPSTASLAPAQSLNCSATYLVTQADIDAGSVTNIASGEGRFNFLPVVSNTDSATVTAAQTKSLSLTKTDDLNPGKYNQEGQVVKFTITATNTGNFTLRNVNVSDDPVLDDFTCTPAIPALALAPGASIECKGTYTITAADLVSGQVTDIATATSDDIEPVTAMDTIYVGLGRLSVVADVKADNGGSDDLSVWTVSAVGTSSLSGQGSVSGFVIEGAYTIAQNGPSGFTTSFECVDAQGNIVNNGNIVNVPVGADITCRFQNDDIAPRLKLIKSVNNMHRRTAQPDDWMLHANGSRTNPTNLVGQTPVESGADFKADTYALAETGPDHYTAEGISCVDENNQPVALINGNQIQLQLGQRATCTFVSVDNIIPNLIVDPGCNCDATGGSPSTSNLLMITLLLGISFAWRRRKKA